jgi:TetR/AcrR family transcriptional regulator, acrAB operon repressor
MARRTKEDALATRHSLLDAAERVFQAKGVSRSSLGDIAAAAGTTRGAIYWHFQDKADLFNAMMERVTLPMEEALGAATLDRADPLPALRGTLAAVLEKIAEDSQMHRVLEIATHKVEYVDELWAIRQRHVRVRNEWVSKMKSILQASARNRGVRLAAPAEAGARGLHGLIDGMIQNWLLDPSAFDLRACGLKTIDVYLGGLGLGAPAPARKDGSRRSR